MIQLLIIALICQLTDANGQVAGDSAYQAPTITAARFPSPVRADLPAPASMGQAITLPVEPAQETSQSMGIKPSFRAEWDGVPEIPKGFSEWDSSAAQPTRGVKASYLLSAYTTMPPAVEAPVQELDLTSNPDLGMLAEDVLLAPTALSMQSDEQARIGSNQTEHTYHPVANTLAKAYVKGRHFLQRHLGNDIGIGHERVMFAPMVVDLAIESPSTGVLFRSDRGLSTPDRLEYIWATPSRGPSAETRVDIFDTVFRMVVGNGKMAAITETTMRSLNPDRNDNTVGFGDMKIGAKATVLDGRCTKVATVFNTYLKTGPSDRGLGTGHVSLEPGILLRRQINQHTFFHGEAKYWLPIAGTPGVAGDVLKLGTALSTVWREDDRFAILPTIELATYTFLSGSATQPNGLTRRINGEFAAELYPGMRCVFGPKREIGLVEFGIAPGFVFADEGWFDSRLVFDVRLAH